jgi:hypothetical protein
MDSKIDAGKENGQDVQEKSLNDTETASIKQGSHRGGLHAWAKALSVESGGIQRVTDEERQNNTTKVWNACTFW